MRRRRTLLVGQLAQPTGMARVLRAVARGLGERRDVDVLAIDARATTSVPPELVSEGFAVHTNPDEHDMFAEEALERLCASEAFDSVVIYHDLWFVPRLLRAASKGAAPVAAYCPIDGACLRPDLARAVSRLDGLAVPTEFARAVVEHALRDGGGSDDDWRLHPIAVLPHGVDTTTFGPRGGAMAAFAERRRAARRALFPERPELWDGFVVLNANRNQARKRLDLTLRGFAAFAAGKPPDVRLYLHWGAERSGADVARLAKELDITDRLVVSSRRSGMETDRLNLLYNAADVGVNTSVGEGWGLVTFEHAATGAAQIVPAHSACEELWRGAAVLLPVQKSVSLAGVVEGGEVAETDLAVALEQLHVNDGARDALARAAYDVACSPAYDWDHIAEQWHTWLGGIEERARRA